MLTPPGVVQSEVQEIYAHAIPADDAAAAKTVGDLYRQPKKKQKAL